MSNYVDLIIDHIGQLCVVPAQNKGPQRGAVLGKLGIVENAALAIQSGLIVAVGPRDEVLANYSAAATLDAGERLATPGLVDSHTHLVWAGDRAEEFEQRLAGATYLEIMAAGGGIHRTVRQTRAAALLELVETAKIRLDSMLQYGTTTAECKTGYGLSKEAELDLLNAIALLDVEHPIDLIPTFLGAHAIPPEFEDQPDSYVQFVIERMIPAVVAWREEHWPGPLFCDVFCDQGAFTLEQTRRIFGAAKQAGMPLRLHSDEFKALGGTEMALQMGATTVDHLLVTGPEDVKRLGKSKTIAVLLPTTPFGLGVPNTAPAKALLEWGAAIALGTDCNPGTAWCESMQMVLALATRALGLTPAQAIAAATINGAYAVGLGEKTGSLEIGKQADLVIWDSPDYRHLGYRFGGNLVRAVVKRGQVVVER